MTLKVIVSFALLIACAPALGQLQASESGLQFLAKCEKALTAKISVDPTVANEEIDRINRDMNVEVIGQAQAVSVISDSVETSLTFLNDPGRPLGRYMFVGPTGVGKTEAVKALIKVLGGDPDKDLTRIDCGEFQHGSEITRIIGATASYVGYGDKPMLHPSELAKRKIKVRTGSGKEIEINVILIDEIEKAGDQLFKLLLGVLDNGKVTLGDNTEVYLRDTIIVATSNLGARDVEALIDAKMAALKSRSGDVMSADDADLTGRLDLTLREQINATITEAIKGKFAPEFINRWQKIVQFLHLSDPEFYQILQKQLARFQRRIFERAEVKAGVLFTEAARGLIISQGTDFKNGARELERTLDRLVTKPVSRLISTKQIQDGDVLVADVDARTQALVWNIAARGLERQQLAEFGDAAYPGYKMLNVNFNKREDDVQAAVDGVNIFEFILNSEAAVKKLYLAAKDSPKADLNIPVGGGKSSTATCHYVKVGERYIRLENHIAGLKANISSGIPEAIRNKFPEDKILAWSEAQVREMLKDLLPKKEEK